MKRDFYETLGVSRTASDAEIKKAYRSAAMKYHPDRNPGDKTTEEKFKEVQEAYDVLRDSKKRQAYDQFGHAGVDPSSAGGFGGSAGGFGFGDFGDIFSEIFGAASGGRGRGDRAQAGADLRCQVEISLEQAVKGTTTEIKIPTWVTCQTCEGSGAKKGSSPKKCGTCDGHGQVRMQQGFFSIQQTCPTCHGQGTVISDPCLSCYGQGRVQKEKTLSVKIPAGVDNGDRIRLAGEGEAGMHGGPAGDVFVQISVKSHPLFEREGSNLYCELPVSFITAALGGEIEAPTLEGRVKLKISPETQTGRVFRLRGKGIRSVRGGGVGDLLCRVVVETPINLTIEQKKLMQELQVSLSRDGKTHTPQTHAWLQKVKQFFETLK